jgi:hypothetical protein
MPLGSGRVSALLYGAPRPGAPKGVEHMPWLWHVPTASMDCQIVGVVGAQGLEPWTR